jgi:release factor glutamine methyltransferase
MLALPGRQCPTVDECLRSGVLLLERAGVQTARLDAECILAHVLGWDRWRLLTEPERRLTPEKFGRYLVLLQRRELREPLAYLLGRREFWSMTLGVSAEVLVPRPETETLVEAALSMVRDNGASSDAGCPYPRPPVLVDLCTGSGAVAVALACEVPGASVYATDISRACLRIARANAERQGVEGRIRFLKGDLWRALQRERLDASVDVIVCNPPYVASGLFSTLMPEVLWEPRLALDGGPDGLHFHREIIAGSPRFLRPGGALLLEIGEGQAVSVMELLNAAGIYGEPRVLPDLAGRDRVVVARLRR